MDLPQVVQPVQLLPSELAKAQPNFAAYAFGWMVTDYRGYRIVTHGGGVYGGISMVVLVHELGIGFSVLSNAEEHHAVEAIGYHLLDHFLELPGPAWIAAGNTVPDRQLAEAEAIVRESDKAPAQVGGALPLSTYAGTNRDAWYGVVTVAESSYGLTLSFDKSAGMNGPLQHVDCDTLRTHWQDPAIESAFVTFAVGPDRKVTVATIRPVSPIADFSSAFQDLALVPDQSAKR